MKEVTRDVLYFVIALLVAFLIAIQTAPQSPSHCESQMCDDGGWNSAEF